MAGQIIKKADRKFLVRVFQGRDASGKRHYFNKLINGTKKEAQDFLNRTLTEISAGTFTVQTRLTVNAYLDQWLETAARPRLRERTFEDYREYLKRYIRPALGKGLLAEIRPLNIQKLYTDMLDRGLSPRTVRYCHAILTSALKQAVKWQILASNPASMVDLPRMQRKEMQSLSPEDAARFLDVARQDKWGVIFSVALTTGLRPEEYLGLQWKDINFESGTAVVRRALVWKRKGGGWSMQEPKTSQSRRSVPMPVSVVRELKAHRRNQAEERMRAGAAYQDDDFVFAGELGNPLLLSNLYRRHFKPILAQAGLPSSFRIYDLRHTCATLLLGAGENAKIVAERLGHSTVVLTLDTYSHVLPTMQVAATAKLEALLFERTGTE